MKATSGRTLLLLTRVIPRKAARTSALVTVLALLICLVAFVAGAQAQTAAFTAEELLGTPTDTSVTVNIVPASDIQYRYDYGTAAGVYTQQTAPVSASAGQPSEVTITGLNPNTQYYYRMAYDADGSLSNGFEARPEHTFRTQRAAGASFEFTVTSDIHNNLGTNEQNVMTNILSEHPDFHIDLGDTFMTDGAGSESGARTRYLNHRGASYLGKIAPSIPIFLATGNHEDEEGWNLDDTGSSATGLWNLNMRKTYFPEPTPGGFYSGNTDPLPTAIGGDTNREDYYAWTWGDALFVVIDEFQYTMNLPYTPTAGELSDDSVTGDQWSWTLGLQQYNWLKSTLQDSHARYKFVFSHQMVGGIPTGAVGVGAGYVRGGAEAAGYFEWGGKNADGIAGFAAHRSLAAGWDKTIQQLFEENGVSAYFHGHDHGFVYEKRPDVTQGAVVYQEVPSAGNMSLFGGIYNVNESDPAFDTIAQRSGNGHLRIAVGSDHATVDYILAGSGAVDYTYDIEPSEPSTDPSITVTGSLSAFASQPGAASAAQSYSVSGRNLTAGIQITAPDDFQISLDDNSGWTSSLTLPQTGGTVSSTPIYVRFNRATAGTSSGNVVHASAGATAQNLAATGTATPASATPITFTGKELLGRPTNTSMTIKVVPDATISLYYEYGTAPGAYTHQTAPKQATAGQPAEVEITGLLPNIRYYYRMNYTSDGDSWITRDEHSFWTQRAAASTFTFDITTDSHINIMLGNTSNWASTLDGVASDKPDFLVDLGDTVAMDNGSASVALGDTAAAEQKYKDTLPYFNRVSASSPIFLLAGNHEQQEAWHLQGTLANSLPIMGKNAEKKFYLNPVPNAFYSGDSRTMSQLNGLSGDHLVQDYYSWTWGDALFVVINPFWTTTTKPYTTSVGGGETDATGSGNRWDWTLGADQFNWLKSTLASSDAKYKFVFSHQMVGGNSMTNQENYGHGGVDSANFAEWGGYNTDGTTYAWSANRSAAAWGSQPIRQMMEANGVTAFFHGHDHQMAYETANGMVNQACPSASFSGSFRNYTTGNTYTVRDGAGQTSTGETVWADSTQGPGHLRVTVGPDETKVEFVRYDQTTTAAYSYTMAPSASGVTHTLTYTAGTGGSISGVSPQTVADGADGSAVTAVPGAGYHFVKWSDDSTANPRTDANVTADVDVTAVFEAGAVPFGVDGTPTSGTGAADASSVSFSHTTGTGTDRLMLVGVSWHTGTTDRTISSVTFTPTGGSARALNEVFTQRTYWSSYPRYSAIYKLLDPPKGVTGTVTVTFGGTVSGGIVAGAVDFAGVDQTTPLGTPNGGASSSGSAPTVTLSGLSGDELVFDNVYLGADDSSQTLSPGSGQTSLWNALSTNTRAAASAKQATGSSATMTWTAGYANSLAIAAVPINPLGSTPTDAETPQITSQPADVSVTVSPSGATLSVTATVTQGTLSYQWYSNPTRSNTGGTSIDGATTSAYDAPTNAPGTTYYYCVVTNTDDAASGNKTASVASDAARVQVDNLHVPDAVIAAVPDQTYTGSAITPAVTVTLDGTVLTAGVDYTVAYTDNIDVGTAKLTVTGSGASWVGSRQATFRIVAKSIASASIAPIADKVYTGQAIVPAVSVDLGGVSLVAAKDFTAACASNVLSGKATVTVTGTGNYTGAVRASFKIVPARSTIAKLKAGPRKFTASWKKHSGASGYQVAYSAKRSSGFRTTTATTSAAKTVKGLKSGRKYFVKLRAFVTIDGARCYGAWSSVKSVRVR